MRKLAVVLLIIFVLSTFVLSKSYEDFYKAFVDFRNRYDKEGMKNLISELESLENKDYKLYTLLADAIVEYAQWGLPKDVNKREYYERARKYAEEAIKLNDKYAYAYFVRGAAIGRLAQYVGILKSLFLVGDFDESMKRAIELDPKCFRAYVAMGMRYRDLPWPFKSFKKSEEYLLKAIEIEPRYINSYLELGLLYEKWDKKEKAIEAFEKVLELPVMEGFSALGKEAKETAKEHLKKLK